MPEDQIVDLRSALARLACHDTQLIETDHPIDPIGELAGVYRRVGAGGTVERPTRIGPAMIFNNVTGFPGWRVLVGLMASRKRVGILLESPANRLTQRMAEAYENALGPADFVGAKAPCHEVVHRADDPDFDLRTLLPAPTNTDLDAGPYFCLGLVLGSDPELGTDVTIHRLCVQGRDEMTIFFAPGRHIDAFRQRAEADGRRFEITVNMGLDPAIPIGATFEAPTTPLGYNELAIAGGLRGAPVELVNGVTVGQKAIASAEVVIEGYIIPGERQAEDQNTHTGHAMPEFPGYDGPANPALPVIKVTAVTTRTDPILQTLVGPGEEHVSLAGIPTEASIFHALHDAMPGFVTDVYSHSAGGGKFLAILKCNKTKAFDDGRARQAALVALGVYSELKNVILVDSDVDIFDTDDVLWAMQTRMQGDRDILTIPGVAGHVLDPSQQPAYDPTLPAKGTTCKTIFDATAPFNLRDQFERAHFRDVDPRPYAPDLDLEYP
ncbi:MULTISPECIES: UbiD family decarboxylase [Mycobacterium avium complex (MAC)]|uniref:UbiD family decarboxylase n=2 Tax=Mycobacterium intracellulare TaxID=1767 RepID=A0AAE4RBY3_MYCIT|nr:MULTISPECIES: UbiD family decarboxylase [Mycobacterium avium complex (MAC)]AFS14469.1 3-octaprenyl-4-hydroxy benzoate [Mycobacterium intracellulare subsp. intracellulare MTCC 9506]ETZ30263.1 3-octaprenyl-4-hydroxybenzoate carboxy-lyase family protein [Mycobacterium intracellulare MIN_052511_1280]MCA2321479.1 UbiD family decarboxylase [Mycobacterium intracellulare]MCA2340944.1 UbiD family decarboxylase [Mycobacterium intracellulare]MDV6975836.1 UbiD family decarboxylase [Mycobacterium intrac